MHPCGWYTTCVDAAISLGTPTEEYVRRFWARVTRGDECWEWNGVYEVRWYGQFYSGRARGRMEKAHRFAWRATNGPIPAGILVLHRCDNPRCVRPDHLFLGTHKDNTADAKMKGRLSCSGGQHRQGCERAVLPSREQTNENAVCDYCKKPYMRQRRWGRFCSANCQKNAWRHGHGPSRPEHEPEG